MLQARRNHVKVYRLGFFLKGFQTEPFGQPFFFYCDYDHTQTANAFQDYEQVVEPT
jgi:hypothetical protein